MRSKNQQSCYLISALNVLNESEINYKSARNKRLHVELALIKLVYLQQALDLLRREPGVSKKKLTDTGRPVAFRNIHPIEMSSAKQSKDPKSNGAGKQTGAKLIIDTRLPEKEPCKNSRIILFPTVNPSSVIEPATIPVLGASLKNPAAGQQPSNYCFAR